MSSWARSPFDKLRVTESKDLINFDFCILTFDFLLRPCRLVVSPDAPIIYYKIKEVGIPISRCKIGNIGRRQVLILMPYVYILKTSKGYYYIGSTENIEMRVKYHQSGKVKSTRGKLPVTLVFKEFHKTKAEAQKKEYKFKSWKSKKMIEQVIKPWPHRLVVRTHGSHPCNSGSTPLGAIL